jgi:hypothetical protein
MAQLINEAKRMQFLAGLITESQLEETEQTNELFGFGAPTLKPGDKVAIKYDKAIMTDDGNSDGFFIEIELLPSKKFKITRYAIDKFEVDNGSAQKTNYGILIWQGHEILINKPLEVGENIVINNAKGPKITSMQLNDKEVKKVNVPK